MPVSSLHFTNLGPFDEVEFEFDPHVNVFVGPNNCGKTTVLLALGDVLVRRLDVPAKLLRGHSHFSATFEGVPKELGDLKGLLPIPADPRDGDWRGDQLERVLLVRKELGFRRFVPALRLSTDYRSPGPAQAAKQQPLGVSFGPYLYYTEGRAVYAVTSQEEADWKSRAWWVRDDEIIQRIVELDYRAYRENRPEIRRVIGAVAEVASQITEGFTVEFAGIGKDGEGYFPQFKTPDGLVPLNVLSQGTQAIIQWCAQFLIGYADFYQYPHTFDDKPAILIVDEIDAHLHPSWQRRILPVLTSQFPSLQVFCATHSPLTVSGLKAGQVHLLRRDEKGKITVSRNEQDILGWTADEIYAGLLGVDPTDLGTSEKLDRVRQLRDKKTRLTSAEKKEFESLRDELHQRMSSGPGAAELGQLADQLEQSARASAQSKANRDTPRDVAKGKKTASKRSASSARGRKR